MVRRASWLVLAGLTLAVGSTALAETPSDQAAAAAPASQSAAHKKAVDPNLDESAVVCRREDTTGTRLGATKVCHTRAEWNSIASSARNQVDTWQNQANATMPH